MSKDVIKVEGEERVVEETTAKAYRGINWMIISMIGFVVIVLLLIGIFFLTDARDGSINGPAQGVNTNTNK